MWRQENLVSLLFVHRLWMNTIEIYIKISLRLHKIWSKHAKLPQSKVKMASRTSGHI